MKTHCTIQAQYGYNHTHRHLLSTSILSVFVVEKLRSFPYTKCKASINAIQYVRNLPKKTIAKRFSQDIFPSSVGIGCKGTTKFADVQEKSHQNAIFMV